MEKIFKVVLEESSYGYSEVTKEKLFKFKEDAISSVKDFMIFGEQVIRENCNYFNLEWIKVERDGCSSKIIEEYSVFYEWEKHSKDCEKRYNNEKQCTSSYCKKENNVGKYSYRIIVSKETLY